LDENDLDNLNKHKIRPEPHAIKTHRNQE